MEKVTLKPRPEQVKEQGYVGIKCLQAEHQAAVGTLSAKTLW
jgi:glutaredoxin-related protein